MASFIEWGECLVGSVTWCRLTEQPRAQQGEKAGGETLRLRVSILSNRNPLLSLRSRYGGTDDRKPATNQPAIFYSMQLFIWWQRGVTGGCEEVASLQRMISEIKGRSVPRELIWRAWSEIPGCRATSLLQCIKGAEWVAYSWDDGHILVYLFLRRTDKGSTLIMSEQFQKGPIESVSLSL